MESTTCAPGSSDPNCGSTVSDSDIPFVIIGTVLSVLAIIVCGIFIYYYVQSRRRNIHLQERKETQANIYTTSKEVAQIRQNADPSASVNFPPEPIYSTVDSFRREALPENRVRARNDVNEAPASFSRSCSQRQSLHNAFTNAASSINNLPSPTKTERIYLSYEEAEASTNSSTYRRYDSAPEVSYTGLGLYLAATILYQEML